MEVVRTICFRFGLANANQDPLEQRDDIEAYNNRFHELALMCPELVPTKKKNIEKYVCGFPEDIKENHFSKLQICMRQSTWVARELVEQSVSGLQMVEEDYAGIYKMQPCVNLHHRGRCPQKCQRCLKIRSHGEECGVKGHIQGNCPKAGYLQNDGCRRRGLRTWLKFHSQNPDVVKGSFLLNDHYACFLFDWVIEKSLMTYVVVDDFLEWYFQTIVRTSREGFYSTKSLTMGRTRALCQEEDGYENYIDYRISKQVDFKETLLPSSPELMNCFDHYKVHCCVSKVDLRSGYSPLRVRDEEVYGRTRI
ncbi:putative reverse transcriptase domain-containing protein [Tanacetum coccineum]